MKLKIFIGWSGETSGAIAQALHTWIPKVVYPSDPWLSVEDIEKGSVSTGEISKALRDSGAAIFCLTEQSLQSTWIPFEVGAIFKGSDQSAICTSSALTKNDPVVLD